MIRASRKPEKTRLSVKKAEEEDMPKKKAEDENAKRKGFVLKGFD